MLLFYFDSLKSFYDFGSASSQAPELLFRWLFAIMARLEKPLSGETVSYIRRLYRISCNMRRFIVTVAVKDEKEEEEECVESMNVDDDDDDVNMLSQVNLLVAITGHYFRQGEEYCC